MNIPEVFYSYDPNTYFLIILILSVICVGLLVLIITQIYSMSSFKSTISNLTDQNDRKISDLNETIKANSIIATKTDDTLKQFVNQRNNQENFLNELKTEITRIADGISGQDTMTKAIELARRGANVNDIISTTGISKEEAEALIKFHKN